MLGFFTSVFVLFVALSLSAANSDEPVYRAVGDEVVLTPGPVSDPITIITWRHGQDIAVEWFKGSVESFRQFKERGNINGTTGALTITGLTPGDSGNYTAEINHKETRTTQLQVISRVSKPTVSKQWDPDNTYWVLTCESDTTNAGPVTYSWISQEKSWDSIKELRITNEESENQFYCELSNPVSTEVSETAQNPFSTWKWYEIVLIVCAALIVLAAFGFISIYLEIKEEGKSYDELLFFGGALILLPVTGVYISYIVIKEGKWYEKLLIVCAVLIVLPVIGVYCSYWEIRGGKWYEILLIVCTAVIVPAGICFYCFYWEIRREGRWYQKLLIVCTVLIVAAGVCFYCTYWQKRGGKWYEMVLIVCTAMIVPAGVGFYIVYLEERRGKWCEILLIVCAALIVPAGVCFYIVYLEERRNWRLTSEIFSYEDKWYLILLMVCGVLIVAGGVGFYWKIKGYWRSTSESTSGRSIPVFSCRYKKGDRGPGSDGPGGSSHDLTPNGSAEPRPENGSVNHMPTSTVETVALVGSSQDQESDVFSVIGCDADMSSDQVQTNTESTDTINKTEFCGESNQEPTADADPESNSQTDIRASPDQVLTDATSEAEETSVVPSVPDSLSQDPPVQEQAADLPDEN